jgi:hypothetical protein
MPVPTLGRMDSVVFRTDCIISGCWRTAQAKEEPSLDRRVGVGSLLALESELIIIIINMLMPAYPWDQKHADAYLLFVYSLYIHYILVVVGWKPTSRVRI